MLTELADVLGRDAVRKLHGQSDQAISGFLQRIESAALLVMIDEQTVPTIVKDDRDDDLVIATAVQGNADVICTLDRHFRTEAVIDYCRRNALEIMDDPQLLNVLRAEQIDNEDDTAAEP